jgi:hypothetical protein
MPYDYRKAGRLDYKARALLAHHRQHVFDANGEAHERAIRRIKRLMAQGWQARASYLAGLRLERMGY